MWRIYLVCLSLLLVPQIASALVVSEVAWMGTSSAADDEWIELYNDGATVSLEGWVIEFGQSSISLSGSLASGGYAVLHRSGETTAPGNPLLTYSGALSNTGTTIVVRRPDGSVADTVNASAGWPAGDNITKETMQRTASGFVTAPQTAGYGSLQNNNETIDEANNENRTSSRSLSPTIRPRVDEDDTDPIAVERALSIIGNDVGYVGHELSFAAHVEGLGERFTPSLRYEWNFGDMNTAKGKEVSHVFEHAGAYLITLYASFGEVELLAQKEVMIRTVPLLIQRGEQGAILITNTAAYDVPLDGYTVRSVLTKTFPKRSVLLPGATVTLKAPVLGNNPTAAVYVFDNHGALVGHIAGVTTKAASGGVARSARIAGDSITQSQLSTKQQGEKFSFASQAENVPATKDLPTTVTENIVQSETTSKATTQTTETTPVVAYYALGALLLFGVAGVLVRN